MNKVIERHANFLVDQLANSTGRTVDTLYASFVHKLGLTQPFFKAGWGDLNVVDLNEGAKLLEEWPPAHFDVKFRWQKLKEGVQHGTPYELLQASFSTPCRGKVFDSLPPESRMTHVQLLAPKSRHEGTACVVHLAGTGDHGFQRRMRLGAPLLSKGIATLALESPYYGLRRPSYQEGSRLLRVSDLLLLGRATIEESLCLLTWAKRQGFKRLGMSGFSMGGVHASMVTSLFPGPVACTPLLAPRSATAAFCDGTLWEATAWKPLASDKDENHQDVMETIQAAAQPTLLTAAAIRVLQKMSAGAKSGHQPARPTEDKVAQESLHTANGSIQECLQEGASVAFGETQSAAASDSPSTQAAGLPDTCATVTNSASSQSKAYGNAARFLGFRLPGLPGVHSNVRWGIGTAERQLQSLWRQKKGMAQEEARTRLEQVLETYTDVTRFPCPQQPEAAVIVGATNDAYVSGQSVRELAAHWPGSEVRWVPGGHVSAFLFQQPTFRQAILDSVSRLDISKGT